MVGALKKDASVAVYELEIEIDADPGRIWEAILNETNAWWLPDFHLVGEGSTVRLDARAGGGLIEELPSGGSLLWYTVQWILPETRTLYLIGHLAPDYGGPSVSHFKMHVEERGGGGVLKVSDGHQGHVDEERLAGQREGWRTLFTDGLKQFVEQGA